MYHNHYSQFLNVSITPFSLFRSFLSQLYRPPGPPEENSHQFYSKRLHRETSSHVSEQEISLPHISEVSHQSLKDQILQSLAANKERFSIDKKLHNSGLANEAMGYLKEVARKKEDNKRKEDLILFRPQMIPNVRRPIFHPDGSISVFNSKKKEMISMKLRREDQTQAYKDLQKRNCQIIESLIQVQSFGEEFDQVMRDQMRVQADVEMVYEREKLQKNLKKEKVEDFFIREMMNKLEFKYVEYGNSHKDVYLFLLEYAKSLSQAYIDAQVQKLPEETLKKYQYEFGVVCLLNALYGNPNVNLIQLHPKYKGFNDINVQVTKAQNEDMEEDSSNLQVQKQKRNQVTQVMKFLCQLQVDVSKINGMKETNINEIYQKAQQYLIYGYQQEAVDLLLAHNKIKMALLVSQMNSTIVFQKDLKMLSEQIQNNRNFNPEALTLIEIMNGNIFKDKAQGILNKMLEVFKPEDPWCVYLYYFLFLISDEILGLHQVLARSFIIVSKYFENQLVSGEQKQSIKLVYLLLKYYSDHRQIIILDNIFKNLIYQPLNLKVTPYTSHYDFRIQFVVGFVMKMVSDYYIHHPEYHKNDLQNEKIKVHPTFFVNILLSYINQLLMEGDFHQALIVFSLIPMSHINIKKKLLSDLILSRGINMVNHPQNRDHIAPYNKLQLPQDIFWLSQAFAFEYNFNNEIALNIWFSLGNYKRAFYVFQQKILPPYFVNDFDFKSSLKPMINDIDLLQDTITKLYFSADLQWSGKGKILEILFGVIKDSTSNMPLEPKIKRVQELLTALKRSDLEDYFNELIYHAMMDQDMIFKDQKSKDIIDEEQGRVDLKRDFYEKEIRPEEQLMDGYLNYKRERLQHYLRHFSSMAISNLVGFEAQCNQVQQ